MEQGSLSRLGQWDIVAGMKAVFAIAIIVLSATAVAGRSTSLDAQPDIAFVDVTVIDVVGSKVMTGMTVVIKGNRISGLGRSSETHLPTEVRQIPSRGKFLVPGLWDMHVHLGNATEAALPMLVAAGVTCVRDMGSPSFETLRRWDLEALTGQRVGPRIFAAGPILDGGVPDDTRYFITNPDEGRRAVDDLFNHGVDFIKVHEHMSRETYFAIASEARTLGIPFAGHVPVNPSGVGFAVSGIEASNAGQKSLEHMFGIPFSTDDPSFPELLATLKRNRTWICPTIHVLWNRMHIKELASADDPRLRRIAPSLRNFWEGQVRGFSPDLSIPTKLLQWRSAGLKALFKAQIPLLAGTDLGFAYVFPGDLAKELEMMVELGMTPADALRTATINAATYMRREDEHGSIDVGKIADCVLLDSDPFQDIHAIEKVRAVVLNGRYLDREALDRAQDIEVSSRRPLTRSVP